MSICILYVSTPFWPNVAIVFKSFREYRESLNDLKKIATFGQNGVLTYSIHILNQTPKSPIKRCSYGQETSFECIDDKSGIGDFGDGTQLALFKGVSQGDMQLKRKTTWTETLEKRQPH